MIATDLIKQQRLDADPRKIQQINFTGNLDRAGQTIISISELDKILVKPGIKLNLEKSFCFIKFGGILGQIST